MKTNAKWLVNGNHIVWRPKPAENLTTGREYQVTRKHKPLYMLIVVIPLNKIRRSPPSLIRHFLLSSDICIFFYRRYLRYSHTWRRKKNVKENEKGQKDDEERKSIESIGGVQNHFSFLLPNHFPVLNIVGTSWSHDVVFKTNDDQNKIKKSYSMRCNLFRFLF